MVTSMNSSAYFLLILTLNLMITLTSSAPMADPIQPPTPADRLALAVCVAVLPGSKPCKAPCNACRVNSAAVAHELAAILRERYGSSATADWLDGVGTHP